MTERALQLLIVDDSCDDAELMTRLLKRSGYRLTWWRVETLEMLTTALRTQSDWDLITCDSVLPRLTLSRVLSLTHALAPDVPVLLVSGRYVDDAPREVKAGLVSGFLNKNRLEDLPALTAAVLSARHDSNKH